MASITHEHKGESSLLPRSTSKSLYEQELQNKKICDAFDYHLQARLLDPGVLLNILQLQKNIRTILHTYKAKSPLSLLDREKRCHELSVYCLKIKEILIKECDRLHIPFDPPTTATEISRYDLDSPENKAVIQKYLEATILLRHAHKDKKMTPEANAQLTELWHQFDELSSGENEKLPSKEIKRIFGQIRLILNNELTRLNMTIDQLTKSFKAAEVAKLSSTPV